MAEKDKQIRSGTKRLWVLIAVVILAVIVAFSFTACSLFTDTVKEVFSGSSGDKDSSGNGDKIKPTDGPGDAGIISTDPIIDVRSSVVTITSSLQYDKASGEDFSIVATHANLNYYELLGMGMINDGDFKRVNIISNRKGSSEVKVNGTYLCSLAAGNYYFYYCVYDSDANIYYDPFRLEIVDSNAAPTNVKINYDIECPDTYVSFRCDCGGTHTVSFDGSEFPAAVGATQVKIIKELTKGVSHTATVTCASGHSTSVAKSAPDSAVIRGGYLDKAYSFSGHSADSFIEDDNEAVDLFEYLAYEGRVTEMKVYVSSDIHSELIKNANGYLQSIKSRISTPWNFQFGLKNFSSDSREMTFQITETDAGEIEPSGYEDSRAYRDFEVVSHHTPHEIDRTRSLAIDTKKKAPVRNVKELLLVAEAGCCPVPEAESVTAALYDKVKDFCYTYLTDDMTEIEKLHVIYDYLAGVIDYDYSALNLYELRADIADMSLSDARDYIDSKLSDKSFDGMRSRVEELISDEDISSTDELIDKLTAYMQSLGAFSVEGVFDGGAAVCEGISYAFMLLARMEGIECYQVTGYALQSDQKTHVKSQIPHAWNKVHLNGKWYCVDATWGNIYINNEKYITHRYFMVDEATLYHDHRETIGKIGYGIQSLALGDVEYYKSVETADGHSLYISNNDDVVAAVAYYLNGGCDYIEVAIAPGVSIDYNAFVDAFKLIKGESHYNGFNYYEEAGIFMGCFVEK